jgi:hypothetical protein
MQTKQLLRLHKCPVILHFYVTAFFDKRYNTEKKRIFIFGMNCVYVQLEITKTIPFSFKKCITKENKMNLKMLKAALAGLVLSVSGFASAGLIFGDLSYESGDAYVTDSLNNREWARLDFFRGTVTQWNSEFNDVNSDLYGFNFSGALDADLFADAAFGVDNYDVLSQQYPIKSGVNANLFTQVMGDGYGLNSNNIWKYFRTDTPQNSDNITYMWLSGQNLNSTVLNHDGVNSSPDSYSNSMSFLVYRDLNQVTDVPEPSTLAIFALGIMGLASRRFKKQ